jgi:hypothetical protein
VLRTRQRPRLGFSERVQMISMAAKPVRGRSRTRIPVYPWRDELKRLTPCVADSLAARKPVSAPRRVRLERDVLPAGRETGRCGRSVESWPILSPHSLRQAGVRPSGPGERGRGEADSAARIGAAEWVPPPSHLARRRATNLYPLVS